MGPNVKAFDNSLFWLGQFKLQKNLNQFEGLARGVVAKSKLPEVAKLS